MNPLPASPPTKRPWLSRRRLLFSAGFLGATAAVGAAYTRFAEPGWLEVTHRSVPLGPSEATPIRVLHLSDLHASGYVPLEFIAQAIQLGLAEKPDLICLTGDFITKHFTHFADYADVLKPLATAAPTFACLGNHDGGKWAARPIYKGYPDHSQVRQCLTASGVTVLLNQSQTLTLRGRQLRVVGLGDLWNDELRAPEAFGPSPPAPATTTLALLHNPDGKDAVADFPWHLALCGHTHGGQLRLPWWGTPFAPVRDHRYVAGLNRWRDRWIFTTRGVGNLHGVRFNCRPEVSVLTVV
ncbi:MAG: phosphodiesterase with model substrate bis-pNPP [Verrucomicrobiota bacterium]|jgi:predicted MPP superfamily phosphohydrolase